MSEDSSSKKVRDLTHLVNRSWVTLPAVARIAGVSYSTILKIHRAGKIRSVKVGGRIRVYEDELVRFLIQGNYLDENTAQRIVDEEQR